VVNTKKFNCSLKSNGITTLTCWCHMTSSVTWPFDLRWATSYGWFVVTMRLSCTIMEVWRLKSWTDGRMHGWMLRWFYILSNAMHCIGWTITMMMMIMFASVAVRSVSCGGRVMRGMNIRQMKMQEMWHLALIYLTLLIHTRCQETLMSLTTSIYSLS